MLYIIYGIIAFLASLALSFAVRRLALRLKIVDIPGENRKRHRGVTPLLGGVAIFLSFWTIFMVAFFINRDLFTHAVGPKQLLGVFLGSLVIMIFGFCMTNIHSVRGNKSGALFWRP